MASLTSTCWKDSVSSGVCQNIAAQWVNLFELCSVCSYHRHLHCQCTHDGGRSHSHKGGDGGCWQPLYTQPSAVTTWVKDIYLSQLVTSFQSERDFIIMATTTQKTMEKEIILVWHRKIKQFIFIFVKSLWEGLFFVSILVLFLRYYTKMWCHKI